MSRAVVALSGGQDSATCLAWAVDKFGRGQVDAITFDYGQRHSVELEAAETVAQHLGVAQTVIPIDSFAFLGQAALTNRAIAVSSNGGANTWAAERGLPSTFVPGRNIVLLGLAAAFALPRGANTVVSGICEMDAAGYPDCRASFRHAMEHTVRQGMDAQEFVLEAPLLWRSKAQTFALAAELDVLDLIIKHTHTCYEGDHETANDWGFGCGQCSACQARADGWFEYRDEVEA